MGIEELAGAHIGNHEELTPLERGILITSANPYYHRGYTAHVTDAHSIDKREVGGLVRSIKRKLDISSDYNVIFTALCIALKDKLISINEILDGKDLAKELPRFKATLRKLTRPQKHFLAECCNQAIHTHYVSMTEVAESLHYAPTTYPLSNGEGQSAYERLGTSNRAQLAFFAHIYMHFMHNPVEEQLTGKQLDALEAIVIKQDMRGMYKSKQDGTLNSTIYKLILGIRNIFNAETSIEVVLKALDMGFYTLLLEADIPAFVSLDPAQIDFLKAAPNPHTLMTNRNIRYSIYRRLGVRTMPQLAPYLFLAAKLDENEMGLLRSAYTSPDVDPMRIVYEKFGIPEGAALLAPSRYLAAKHSMAAKN